jgi:hypothetical protein
MGGDRPMKAENTTDRDVCECPRCGKSHWKLGNSPLGAKLAQELRFWGGNGETESQDAMLRAAAVLAPLSRS